MRRLCSIPFACLLLTVGQKLKAQSFQLMRYDEDYSSLGSDSSKGFYNKVKFLPLSKDKNIYLSFGGEMRYEYVSFNNEDWGAMNIGQDNFFLQRYDLHADIHWGRSFRIFAQLRSAFESGRETGPRPIDEDKLNVQNLFADLHLWKHKNESLTLRAGRQEINYGAGRLISVREGPNLRLYFTGGKLMYTSSKFQVDGFAFMADSVFASVFDNKQTKEANLWGMYATLLSDKKRGNFDFYYLGIRRDNAVFEEGTAKELRHTLGTRFWKTGDGFIYNFEAAYQFGKFGSGKISAWTASADVGYVFKSPLKPSLNLRHDYISGDKKAGDGNLQTFNPIYPKGGYFGFDPQVGPVNLIDIHPYFTIAPTSKLTLQADMVFNWRYSLQDGIYRPSGNLNMAGANSRKRYIGNAYLISGAMQIDRFVSATLGMQYFKTGSFVKDEIPNSKNGLFVNAQIGFKF